MNRLAYGPRILSTYLSAFLAFFVASTQKRRARQLPDDPFWDDQANVEPLKTD